MPRSDIEAALEQAREHGSWQLRSADHTADATTATGILRDWGFKASADKGSGSTRIYGKREAHPVFYLELV